MSPNSTPPQPISHLGITTMATFRVSESAPWGVLDHWIWNGNPLGVFTVTSDHAIGEDWLSDAMGDHRDNHGLAVVDTVAANPADRLREALAQSQQRQEVRLGGHMQSEQVWPPPGADTIVILKVAGDSRQGWLRVTWDSGEVHVQGDATAPGRSPMQQEIGPDVEMTDREVVRAWAIRRDYFVWRSWAD